MAGSDSGSGSKKRRPSRKYRPHAPTIKLDKYKRLNDQSDYPAWRDSSLFVFEATGTIDILREEEQEPTLEDGEEEDAWEDRMDRYRSRYHWLSIYFLETVNPQWHPILTAAKTPSKIWHALKDKFARENTTSFHSQFAALLSLKVTSKSDLSDTITKFDTEWTRLNNRCSTATAASAFKLPFVFKSVFESPEAKAAFLLNTLPSSMYNIKDNLMTKDNLTYEACYQRLMDITTEGIEVEDKAYTAQTQASKQQKQPSKQPTTGEKDCSYCRKHYPNSKSAGHIWSECNKLKKDKEKKKEKDGKPKEERAAQASTSKETSGETTVSSLVEPLLNPHPHTSDTAASCYYTSFPPSKHTPSTKWIWDTGSSSHMTNNLDLFLNITRQLSRVTLADKTTIHSYGHGEVAIQGKSPNGEPLSILMRRVLYVPELDVNLFSWLAICDLGFVHVAIGSNIFVRNKSVNGPLVLWATRNGLDFEIQQMENKTRLSTFEEWHRALGHVSPANMKSSCYSDGQLIPALPNGFECPQCSLSKSTNKVPPPAQSHAKKSLDMFHSDLSGKFSIQSFGKSLYYITCIDDKTHYAWVRFLREKSDAEKAIEGFIKERKQQDKAHIPRFRTDGGGEYVNKELREFFAEEGIIHKITPPYSHESNGIAERFNRTIVTMARAMLDGLPKALWSEAIATAST